MLVPMLQMPQSNFCRGVYKRGGVKSCFSMNHYHQQGISCRSSSAISYINACPGKASLICLICMFASNTIKNSNGAYRYMDVNNNDRSAIVTGASGHTGSFLVNLLADHGWHVVATDLPESKRAAILTKEDIFSVPRDRLSIDRPGVDFIPADLTQVESFCPVQSVGTRERGRSAKLARCVRTSNEAR
jgi:hypothetical protein